MTKMNWTDIEQKLQDRAEEVCRHLLPEGKRQGGEFVCANLRGEKGDSLKINLTHKLGTWTNFNPADGNGKGGKNLLGLWAAVRNLAFRDAIFEAKQFLGIVGEDWRRERITPYPTEKKPERSTCWSVAEAWPKCHPLTEGGPVWQCLTGERRIEPQVLALYDVREMVSEGEWVMVFPYFAPKAEELTVVIGAEGPQPPSWLKFERLRREKVDGKLRKKEWTSPGPKKCAWGCQVLENPMFKMARGVILTEGEKDCLSWASYGCGAWNLVPASVPFGAKWKSPEQAAPSPNREWLDRSWDWLQFFEVIYIAMDSDAAGRCAAQDLVNEIGPRRCRLVTLPQRAGATEHWKDVNECLMAGVAPEVMKECLDKAQDFPPKKIVSVEAYRERFMEHIFSGDPDPGLSLPFNFPFKIRPSELTVWTGIEKSGKSTMLSFVLMNLITQGERALIASMEVKAIRSLDKWARQAFGGFVYDREILARCTSDDERVRYLTLARERATRTFDWLAGSLWLYDHVGIAQWRELIEDIRWARYRFGIRQFVVDNFMRLGITKDDYPQQADAINAFSTLAMELDCHIHMVVHQNKAEGHRGREGGKRTVSGAFEIIASAHNIIEIQRDEQKGQKVSELWDERKLIEADRQKANYAERIKDWQQRLEAFNDAPDGRFILRAQRDGDCQDGSKMLWFMWQSQQYSDKPPTHTDYGVIRFVKAPPVDDYELPEKP
jgi:twinkle protein